MRIVHVIGHLDPAYGGPVGNTLQLARFQARSGHDVRVVSTSRRYGRAGSFAMPEELPFPVVLHPVLTNRYGVSLPLFRDLWADLHRDDVIHFHNLYEFALTVGVPLAKRRGCVVVVQAHGALTRYHHGQKRWKKAPHEWLVERRALRAAELVPCSSDREQADVRAIERTAHTVVIPHGVAAGAAPLTMRSGPSARAQRKVLFLGRVAHKKRLDLVIRAMAAVRKELPVHLDIVGPGDDAHLRSLRELVRAEGVADLVHFRGPAYGEAKFDLMADADLFVLPSDDESYGQAAAEAISMQLPVLASRHVACLEGLPESASIMEVDSTPLALSRAMTSMLTADLRAPAFATAQNFFRERSWESVAERFVTAYESSAQRRTR